MIGKNHKAILATILAILTILTVTACGRVAGQTESSSRKSKNSSEEVEYLHVQMINAMSELKKTGDERKENGIDLLANYYYGVAGASISAFRFAVDCMLYLKGEGESLSEIVGDAYDDWDTIAAINYASPYPDYFEGLIYQIQDDEDKAKECYVNAILNPNFPEQDISFYYLFDFSIDELYSLKEELTAFEKSIYEVFTPVSDVCERNPYNHNDEYLRAAAQEVLKKNPEDIETAFKYYNTALLVNPFEGKNFAACALISLRLGDLESAIYYVNEGLFIDEECEELGKLAEALQSSLERVESND
jgi:tetratricopeptide (TPR) repeat protein